jgi:ubiquinone/menaquinone biosynthesis C-methylase UbiE
MSGRGLYLNLGYWKDAAGMDEACEALALLVGERAGIAPGDRVLDVGFGFAEQDMLWADRFRPAKIVGVNITPSQVEAARRRVAERGYADRIELQEGDAVALPFPDASFDRVVGVECAFHFHTRERFLAEARRVLRPGGRLALADVIAAPPPRGALRRFFQWYAWQTFRTQYDLPRENVVRRDRYAEQLREAGFADAAVESISEHVYPGFHRCLAKDPSVLQRFHLLARLPYKMALPMDPSFVYGAFDYVLATADAPAA